ncbi:ABC transporter permease subunit [Candidatus Latescibacterota bacterium]
MGPVFLHRLFDHLKSLRFQVSLVVLLLFFVANGLIYSLKANRLVDELGRIDADNESTYAQVETVGDAVGTWFSVASHPLGTEFVAEGGFNWFYDSFSLSARTGRTAPDSGSRLTLNNWMDPFEMVDWILIVRLVLSFLCVVLAYDAISGDLESGLLRQALANPISRGRYLAARFLADAAVVLVSLACGSLISLLILALSGAIEIDLHLLRPCGLFLLATFLYASTFLLLAMGISALMRSSATSLVFLLLLWAVVVVVVPQAAYLLGVDAARPRREFYDMEWERDQQTHEALRREGIVTRDLQSGRMDDYAIEREYARRLQEMEAEIDGLRREMLDQEVRQYRQTQARALVSPGAAYQYTVEAFLGTGVPRYEHFAQQAWRYREDLRDFFRTRDAADPESPHVLFLPQFMSQQPLDPAHMPRFRVRPLPLSSSVAAGMPAILLLATETLAAFLFAFWAFARLDLTG